MALSSDDVRKIAHLARLKLNDDELSLMTRQLGSILEYVEQLKEVSTEGVEPLAHPLPIVNVFREDILQPSLSVSEALANAPDRRGDFFAVPAVLE
jgi:aspartyl-tRNA(Asn)/glutamyl-tRNA(Gln) amidotransferase subunit C